jgi:hypothetical protein
MKHAFHSFKVAATGRWAVALPVFLLTIPFGVLVSVERENSFNPGSPLSRSILITSAGYFASFLYIFTIQATLLRNRKRELQPLLLCAFVWYSTGAIQGLAAAFYAHSAFGYSAELAGRLPMPTIFTGTALALIAFYFGSIERRRTEDEALRQLNRLMSVDKYALLSADSVARGEALSVLQNVLGPQIQRLQLLLTKDSLNIAGGSRELVSKSREISQALMDQANVIAQAREIGGSEVNEKSKKISFLSGIFPHTLSVRISIIIIALGAFTGQFPRNGLTGVIAGECGALLIGLLLFGLARMVKSRGVEDRRVFLLFSYIIVFLGQALWTYITPKLGFELNNPYPPFYAALKTLYGVYIASIISSLIVETATSLEASKAVSELSRNEMAHLNREQEILEQHIFTTRFGTLQGKISGVIMSLRLLHESQLTDDLAHRRETIMANAKSLLDDALREIAELGKIDAK